MGDQNNQKSGNSQTALDKTIQVLAVVFKVIKTIIKWYFILITFFLGIFCAIAKLILGDDEPRRPKTPRPARDEDEDEPDEDEPDEDEIDPDEIPPEIEDSLVEDFLEQYGYVFEEFENEHRLKPEEQKVIRKLRRLDRSKLRSQMREVFIKYEIKILFLIYLKILSGEL